MATTKKNLQKSTTMQSFPIAEGEKKARMALMPSVNGAAVIHAYQDNVMGKDVPMSVLSTQLEDIFTEIKGGSIHNLEAMLVSQAMALQTIFTSLAREASLQKDSRNLECLLRLALKAQAQSRATISELVDLKLPRQATFVTQANIAHGPQQVNNGVAVEQRHEEKQNSTNKLSGRTHELRQDTRASCTAISSNPAVAAVEKIHRAKIRDR